MGNDMGDNEPQDNGMKGSEPQDNEPQDRRLEDMEQTLLRLERMVKAQQAEIAMLRNSVQQNIQPQNVQWQNIQPQNIQWQNVQPQNAQPQNVQWQNIQPQNMQWQNIQPQNVQLQNTQPQAAGAGETIENRVGKSMGIVASVLVFISMVLFATLVYSNLSDAVKVAALFVFSACMLVAGLWWMRRDCNFFALSLAGCGMGAIFLSLFITYVYFHMINQWWLYGLVALWAVCVKLLSGRERYCFEVVGQAGVMIAIVFGCCNGTAMTYGELYFLAALYVCIGLFYMAFGSARGVAQCFPVAVLNLVSILALCFKMSHMGGGVQPGAVAYGVSVALAAVNVFVLYWYVARGESGNRSESVSALYVVLVMYSWWATSEFLGGMFHDFADGVVFAVKLVLIVAFMGVELLRGMRAGKSVNGDGDSAAENSSRHLAHAFHHDVIHYIITYVLYFALVMATNDFSVFAELVGIGLYIFPLLIFGYWLGDRSLVILAYITMAWHGIMGADYLTINTVITVLAVLASGFALVTFRKMYDRWTKCVWYVLVLFLFVCTFGRVGYTLGMPSAIRQVWEFMVVALVNGIAGHVGFARSWGDGVTEEKEPRNLTLGINALMLLVGLGYLGNGYYKDYMKLCLLVVTALVCLTNVVYVYDEYRDKAWSGIYTGLKLSIFVLVALRSYDVVSPVVSICWIVLAIVFIGAGFVAEYRYLRLYGLFLTCFSIIKLLAFDISYHSGIVRAASFLVSGILCFVINLVYDYFNRKTRKYQ
jgi:hypothetical protein